MKVFELLLGQCDLTEDASLNCQSSRFLLPLSYKQDRFTYVIHIAHGHMIESSRFLHRTANNSNFTSSRKLLSCLQTFFRLAMAFFTFTFEFRFCHHVFYAINSQLLPVFLSLYALRFLVLLILQHIDYHLY